MNLPMRFLHDQSGNFGILTAIVAVPLIAVAGAAIDYSHAIELRSRLMGAADAAALAVIAEESPGYKAASSMKNDGRIASAETAGRDLFLSNAANSFQLRQENIGAVVEKTDSMVSSAITFSAEIPTFFLHLVGVNKLPVTGTATASFALGAPTYADYHFLLDNSPSMGIGANPTEINKLISATGCAFACHEVWKDSKDERKGTNYLVAREKDIKLRIDDLQQAVLDTIEYSKTIHQGAGDRARFSAYTFGKNVLNKEYKIQQLSALTADTTSLSNAMQMLKLMETYGSGHNDDALTSIGQSLGQIDTKITEAVGTGSSTSSREQIILLVTDGASNSLKPKNCTGVYDKDRPQRCFEPVDVNDCKKLKDRGIKIAVMYTTYHAIKDHLYVTYVKQFADRIGPKLKECASPDLYAEVTVEQDMSAVMKKLFEKATSARKLRLTS